MASHNQTTGGARKVEQSALRRWPQLGAGIALAILCSVLAARNVDINEVGRALGGLNYGMLILALAATTGSLLIKAVRWRFLLSTHYRPSFYNLFSTLLIGMFVNSVFPIRAGELARAYLFGESEKISKTYALSTIVTEKVLDSFMLLLLLAILMPLVPVPLLVQRSGFIVGVMGLSLLICLIVAAYQRGRLVGWMSLILERLPLIRHLGLSRYVDVAILGLEALQQWRVLLSLLVCSMLAWFLGALANLFGLLAMGIYLPFSASLLVLLLESMGGAAPSSPGKIGVFHYLAILALAPFDVGKDIALGYGIVLHLVVYTPQIVLGLYYIWKRNLTLGWLKRASREPEEGGLGG